ncbi:peptidoglycan bridge formation glycyltransferase FemA/FemB family protein [Mammaliicoccus sp. Q-M61]|uniref:peptidoglycan bridge formation glycyltransferase FemA/FemB family protein n=1 Tax=Mammaliicoccus sp. Q-M61 TaxID=2898720 RepID=UPI0035AB922B
MVGVKNDKNEVVIAILFTKIRAIKFLKYLYSHRGMLTNYYDIELVKLDNFLF